MRRSGVREHGKNPPDFGYNLGEYLRGVIASVQTKKAALVDGLEGPQVPGAHHGALRVDRDQ